MMTLLLALVTASDFYVSPSGSAGNTGSISSPWDLQTALNQPAAVRPGDTIWLRGGTYRSGFRSNLVGRSLGDNSPPRVGWQAHGP